MSEQRIARTADKRMNLGCFITFIVNRFPTQQNEEKAPLYTKKSTYNRFSN